MEDNGMQLLESAVARNGGAVLSIPTAGMPHNMKSRFLGQQDGGIWLEAGEQAVALLDSLIARGDNAGVAFRSGGWRGAFITRILQRRDDYRINADTVVRAVLISRPAEVKVVQRRIAYRASLTQDCGLTIRMWKLAEQAPLDDRPLAALEVPCKPFNFSIGGMGAVVAPLPDGGEVRIAAEQRLRIAVTHEGSEILVEGRIRHITPTPDGRRRLGIQFGDLESSIEGRRVLSKLTGIVGTLSREEARRRRLGSARAA